MRELQIVIPTYRRLPRQATLGNLPSEWRTRTTLVIDEKDYELRNLYDLMGAKLLVHPPEINTIAKKRKWIIEQDFFKKIIMFDDDLRFAVRRQGSDHKKLFQATHEEVDIHLQGTEMQLDLNIHVGWSARQGNNNYPKSFAENARMMFVLGYDCEKIRMLVAQGKVELGRVRTREDMELNIQLLKAGYPNLVCFDIAADQVAGFAAKGGCSEERTIESTSEDAQIFANLHPGIVKPVQKKYKGSPDRTEVIVYWKKAYASSVGNSYEESTGTDSEGEGDL